MRLRIAIVTADQRFLQFGYRLRKLIMMKNIVPWNATDSRSQIAQNVSE